MGLHFVPYVPSSSSDLTVTRNWNETSFSGISLAINVYISKAQFLVGVVAFTVGFSLEGNVTFAIGIVNVFLTVGESLKLTTEYDM